MWSTVGPERAWREVSSCAAWRLCKAGKAECHCFCVLVEFIISDVSSAWVQLLLIVWTYLCRPFSTFIKVLSQTCNFGFTVNVRGLNCVKLIILFGRWGKWGSQMLRNQSKVTCLLHCTCVVFDSSFISGISKHVACFPAAAAIFRDCQHFVTYLYLPDHKHNICLVLKGKISKTHRAVYHNSSGWAVSLLGSVTLSFRYLVVSRIQV